MSGEAGARLDLRMPSDPAEVAGVRRQLEAFAQKCGLERKLCEDIGLCVNEALANIIRHAYNGAAGLPVELVAADLGDTIRITIRDWGRGVNPAAMPCRQHDPLTPGGLGLVCLRKLMSSVRFEPQPDGMLLITLVQDNPEFTAGYKRS